MLNDSDTLRDALDDAHWSVFDDVQVRPALSTQGGLQRLRPGECIAGTRWIVKKSLGRGGVGEVFEVEHELLGRKAAFKVLHAHNLLRRGLAERMKMEGQWLGTLCHENIIEAFDMGTLGDGRPYLVLELLDGCDLRTSLQRLGVFSVPTALEIVLQVLQGLSALHDADIVHRDIKLENLFHNADGTVVILDLGAAARMGEDTNERAPSLGTPRTMAPEQYEGKPIDGRADLYALGLVLYELLTGRGPFDDVSGLEALRFAHCQRTPAPPSEVAPQFIPPEIDALVLRALAKSPWDRFVSADVMAAEIAALRSAAPIVVDGKDGLSLTERKDSVSKKIAAASAWFVQSMSTMSTMSTVSRRSTMSTMSSPFHWRWRRPFVSRRWTFPIAMLALVIATLALGIAVGKRLPRIDVAVRYGG
jgi:eukaryotic-like serine/threonine-protein kinase